MYGHVQLFVRLVAGCNNASSLKPFNGNKAAVDISAIRKPNVDGTRTNEY